MPPRVTLYSKPDCHLCELVEQTIARVRPNHPFDFEKRNILDDPADEALYAHAIPVICVNGREIARYRISEGRLIAALQADTPDV